MFSRNGHEALYEARHTANLIRAVEAIADLEWGGHYTVLRFSTHYKACWGTPCLDDDVGRYQVKALKPHDSLDDALMWLLKTWPTAVADDEARYLAAVNESQQVMEGIRNLQ